MLLFQISNKCTRQQFEHGDGPIEFGRGPKREPTPRCSILDDPYVSKDHVRIEESADKVQIENLSTRNPIWLADNTSLTPGSKSSLELPVRLTVGETLIDISAAARPVFVNQAKGDSLAEMQLESMGQMIDYDGEIAILSSTPTAGNQNAWIAFMQEQLKKPKYAKMKVVQIAYGQENEQTNQQQALALVQAFPNLKGIIVPSGLGLPAAARALEQAGMLGKIKLTGLAPATLIKKYIQGGTVQDIWWNVKDLGYLTYYAAQAIAQCKITGKEGETFKAGRLGEYKIGASGEIVLGPAQIVTPKNVEEFKF